MPITQSYFMPKGLRIAFIERLYSDFCVVFPGGYGIKYSYKIQIICTQ